MKPYKILIASDSDYNELVAEIYFHDEFVCMVTQERKDGTFDVEFPGPNLVENLVSRRVEFGSFINALNDAKQSLMK